MTLLASGIILFRLLEGVPHLLLLRHSQGKHWGFAKGRRDPADAHEIATARREVEEETGYTDVKLNPMFRSLLHYSVRDEIGDSIPKRVAYFLGPEDFVIEYTAEVEQVDESYPTGGPDDWGYPSGRSDNWGVTDPPSDRMHAAHDKIAFAAGVAD